MGSLRSLKGQCARSVGSFLLAAALSLSMGAEASAADPIRLRIVGGLANVNQYTRHEQPFWTQQLPQLTAGKLTAEIVPFDRAGIRGQEMLRLMQLGVVPFGTVSLGLASSQEPLLAAPDLAGLNPDIETARKSVAAFRPTLDKTLRDRYGIELLAVYIYPAQLVFCKKPLANLADLSGRRVRISSAHQADFIEALGGVPVQTGFAEIIANIKSGNVDCAITGSMSGNGIGLPEHTGSLYTMPITWGMSIFGANAAAWNALPSDARTVLRQALPKLEQAIWGEAERETIEGIDCNTDAAVCVQGRRFSMTAVTPSRADEAQRRALFSSKVLPRWLLRCGHDCAEVWNTNMRPVVGPDLAR